MEEDGDFDGAPGYGKTQRGRRHRAQPRKSLGRGPYSRPAPLPPAREEDPDEGPHWQTGLFGGLRSLITKVPVLGAYFSTAPAAAARAERGDMDGDAQAVLGSDEGPDAGIGSGGDEGNAMHQEGYLAVGQLQLAGQRGTHSGSQLQHRALPGRPQARKVAFQSPVAVGTPKALAQSVEGGGGADVGTPYDSVLAMLRQGPLAANSPRSFPRPQSTSLMIAGAGRTPGLALAFNSSASPSPLQHSGGGTGATASRLGAHMAGGSSTPSTGLRTAYTARSSSRFSRTPVHMQPLAAGVLSNSGGAAGPTSRFGLAASAASGRQDGGGMAGAATSLLGPAPLAWTPMRSNLAAGTRVGGFASGAKRKAQTSSLEFGVEAGDGSISLLDAQRRIRQRSEPAGALPGASSCQRASNAGRTPFHSKAAGPSHFVVSQQQKQQEAAAATGSHWGLHENSVSPALPGSTPAAAAAPAAPGSGSRATTETARRILATLDALDKVVAGSPASAKAAAVAAALGEAQPSKGPAASPPPTASLGFAGLPRADNAQEAGAGGRERTVSFGGVSFAPTPAAPSPARAAPPLPAATADAAAQGWGDAFLTANKDKAAAAAEAAAVEAEGGMKPTAQAVQPASGFTFGLEAVQHVASGDTPSLKQRTATASADLPAAAVPPAQPALFTFKLALNPSAPSEVPAHSALTSTATQVDAAPKYAFGGSSSNGIAGKVAVAVAAAPADANGPVPTFLFGSRKTGGKAVDLPVPAAQANQAAADAAKSPLPDSDSSDEEAATSQAAPTTQEAPAAGATATPPSSGGWDLSFLQSNKVAAQQATEAAAEEAQGATTVTAQAEAPKFVFGAPPAGDLVPTPALPSATLAAFSAASSAGAACAPAFDFGAAVKPPAGANAVGFGPGATSAAAGTPAVFGFGSGASSADAVSAADATVLATVAPASASGWGAAFLQANQTAASKATDAAAEEIGGVARSGGLSVAATAPSSAMPSFGVLPSGASFGFGAASSTAAAASTALPTFHFGAAPSSAAVGSGLPATASADIGTTPAQPAAAAPVGFAAAHAASAVAPVSSSAASAPFVFGDAPQTAPATATAAQAPLFKLEALPQPPGSVASAPAAAVNFVFGAAAAVPAAGNTTSQPNFPAAAPAGAAGSAPAPAAFGFGAASSAAAPVSGFPAPFAFGASSSAAAPASAVPASFGFGGSGAAGPAPSAASLGGCVFGANGANPSPSGFTNNGDTGSIEMLENGSGSGTAVAPASGFQFGGAQAGAGGFGSTFTFGQQPALQPMQAPAFGAQGGFGGAPQPGFGGGFGCQAAPAFGAPQQPAFGAAPTFAFGGQAPQQAAPAAPSGPMIPNNPFGGMGGGGFSIGSNGGGSQSESGRRKIRVKRASRK